MNRVMEPAAAQQAAVFGGVNVAGEQQLPPPEGRENVGVVAGQDDNDDSNSVARDDDFRTEDDLSQKLSQDDPNRMKLTAEEHHRAEEIKELVEGMPDLDNMTDFMYAQLAIICKDDMDDAIRRCYGLQGFKQEYKILDSPEHGQRHLEKMFQLFPREYLSFSFSPKDGTYVFIHDCTKFEPQAFTSPEMADEWMVGMYYSHTLFGPDLESVRKGIIVLVECEGVTMRRDVIKHFQAFFSQLLSYYPFVGKCRHFHTGTLMNVASSILRKILPKDLRDTYEVGLQFDGHMGDIFLTPTVEQANQRMLTQMVDTLKRRYNNEKSFTL